MTPSTESASLKKDVLTIWWAAMTAEIVSLSCRRAAMVNSAKCWVGSNTENVMKTSFDLCSTIRGLPSIHMLSGQGNCALGEMK